MSCHKSQQYRGLKNSQHTSRYCSVQNESWLYHPRPKWPLAVNLGSRLHIHHLVLHWFYYKIHYSPRRTTMLSADNAAVFAVKVSDAADTTMSIVSDVAVAVCQMGDRSPPKKDSASIEVDFDGFQNKIISDDDGVSSIFVVERDGRESVGSSEKSKKRYFRGRSRTSQRSKQERARDDF